MRPRYCVSPICAAIIANTRLDVPEVAFRLAAAERRIGFVDDDHDRPHRTQHRQDALEIPFRFADVSSTGSSSGRRHGMPVSRR